MCVVGGGLLASAAPRLHGHTPRRAGGPYKGTPALLRVGGGLIPMISCRILALLVLLLVAAPPLTQPAAAEGSTIAPAAAGEAAVPTRTTRRLWVGACSSPAAKGWSWLGGSMLSHSGQCVAAHRPYSSSDSMLTMQQCNASDDPTQQWQQGPVYIYPGGFISLRNETSWGWAVTNATAARASSTPVVSMVWAPRTADPAGFCAQYHDECTFIFDGNNVGGGFIQQLHGNCIVAAATPPPLAPPAPPPLPPPPAVQPMSPTCAPHSPSATEQFCNASLSFGERSAALVERLTLAEKLELWTVTNMRKPIPRLHIRGFNMGATCIHGGTFNRPNISTATVGPHAINQAATFDLHLVEKMSNVTAAEMRAHNVGSSREGIIFLECAGGPLANSAHDPRCGSRANTPALLN
jgi:hypothetical protein